MRTFGAFSARGGKQVYGELIGDEVHVLKNPFWLGLEPTGEKFSRHDLEIAVPVLPSKLIAAETRFAATDGVSARAALATTDTTAPTSSQQRNHRLAMRQSSPGE